MTFCVDCGKKMRPEAAFCFACGAKKFLEDSTAETADSVRAPNDQGSGAQNDVGTKSPSSPAEHPAKLDDAMADTKVEAQENPAASVAAITPAVLSKPAQPPIDLSQTSGPESQTAKLNVKPKKKRSIWKLILKIVLGLVLFGAVIIAGIFAYFYLDSKSNTPPQALIVQPMTEATQRRFEAQKHVINRIIADNEARRLREEVEFDIAKETRQIKTIGEFVKKYPETPFYSEAEDEARKFLDEQGTLGAYRVYKKYFGDADSDYKGVSERKYDKVTYIGYISSEGLNGPGKIIFDSITIEGSFVNSFARPTGDATVTYPTYVVRGIFKDGFLQRPYTCRRNNGSRCTLKEPHPLLEEK